MNGQKKKILLVEDDMALSAVMVKTLCLPLLNIVQI